MKQEQEADKTHARDSGGGGGGDQGLGKVWAEGKLGICTFEVDVRMGPSLRA